MVDEHSAEEQPHLIVLPTCPYDAVLTVNRRISQEGMVAVGSNQHSVPDASDARRLKALEDDEANARSVAIKINMRTLQ